MADPATPGNRKERLRWFNEIGFGLFIHWSLDSQIGSVIGHSMAGASEEYLEKYTRVLPSMFNPKRFDPDEWAQLANLAGIRYVVFTTKHHNGFCMFHTETTQFNISNLLGQEILLVGFALSTNPGSFQPIQLSVGQHV